MMEKKPLLPRGALLPLALLIVLEAGMVVLPSESFSLAPPSQIAMALLGAMADGSLFHATMQTLAATVAGFVIGGGIGLLTGVLLGLIPTANAVFHLPIEFVRALPPIALIPVLILISGFGARLEIIVIVFASIWPSLILTRTAVQNIHPKLLEVAKVLDLGPLATLWKIVLPALVPATINSLRVTIALALVVAVTVEIAGNPVGLGNALMTAQQTLQPSLMLAYLVWIGFLGWFLNLATLQLGRLSVAQQRGPK